MNINININLNYINMNSIQPNFDINYDEPAYKMKQQIEKLVWKLSKNKIQVIIKLINELFDKKNTCLSKITFIELENLDENRVFKVLEKNKKIIKKNFNYEIPEFEDNISEFIIDILRDLLHKSGYNIFKYSVKLCYVIKELE